MHFGDRLIDTILVLLSLESVMLDVVDQFEEKHTHQSVVELVLKRVPSQCKEDGEANGSVNEEIHDHLVVEEHDGEWDVVTELLLYPLDLSLPGVDVGANDRLADEVVE